MPDRDVEDRRGFGVGQPQVVMDDEDRAVLGRQAPEAAFELVAVREWARRVLDAGRFDRVDVDLDRPALGAVAAPGSKRGRRAG